MATTTDQLDRTFAALADPTRRAILARLAAGEASVTELAEPFEMSLPAVSKHLKVLERAGLIARGRSGSGGPPGSRPGRSKRSPSGPKGTAASGRRATTDWTSTWTSSRDVERRRAMGGSGSSALTVTTPSDREIVMTRVFDAPRDLVFEAHTSCEHMSNWWGPRKYEVASCEIDFRPGGAWRIVHRGPEGEEHGFRGEFREIVRPERIVWTFEYEGMPGHVSVDTLTLEEHDGKTTLTATSVFDTVEDRDGMLESGMESGAAETMDRLDEYLEVLKGRAAG